MADWHTVTGLQKQCLSVVKTLLSMFFGKIMKQIQEKSVSVIKCESRKTFKFSLALKVNYETTQIQICQCD